MIAKGIGYSAWGKDWQCTRDGGQEDLSHVLRDALCCYLERGPKEIYATCSYPLGPIQGRGLAVELSRGGFPYMVIVPYFSPRPLGAQLVKQYLTCCGAMKEWVRECFRGLPARVHPILMGDINDGLGTSKVSGEWVDVDARSVGRVRGR
eukprot:4215503-Pyramimonas_sp.AAC.1